MILKLYVPVMLFVCPFYPKFSCLEIFLHLGCTKNNFVFVFIYNYLNSFSKNGDSYKKLFINENLYIVH